MIFMKYLNFLKIKNAKDLSKFGTSNISSIPISILIPKISTQNLLKFGAFDVSNANLGFEVKNDLY